ncbi:MAG: hypothetical protein CSA62_02865 [Planctomycetota bacterium]|nr:MAG: hypothetical protein CSA62_02865 [Planctomycetota bacterium]
MSFHPITTICRKTLPLAIALFALAGDGHAQVKGTLPKGFLQKQGNASYQLGQSRLFGLPLTRGWSVVDASQVGQPLSIRALNLRQTCSQDPDPKSQKTSMRLYLRMGHAKMSKVGAGPLALSTAVTSWSVLIKGKSIVFPDYSQFPKSQPAAWSLRIPLPKPFLYDRKNGIAVQIYAIPAQGSSRLFAFDGIDESRARSYGQGRPIGKGCRFHGQEIQVHGVWTSYASKHRMTELEAESFPAASEFRNETLLLLGATNPNRSIGLCARLHSSAEIILPMNTPVGHVPSKDNGRAVTIYVPYHPNLVGTKLYLQSWGIDRSSPTPHLVGSRGLLTGGLPARPKPSSQVFVANSGPINNGFADLVVLVANAGPIFGIE